MSDFHKELITEILQTWSVSQIEEYIDQLEERAVNLSDWIKHLKTIRRRKARRLTPDNGVRGGM
jgi:hypothetical protein